MILHSQIFGEGTPLVILHGFLGMGDNWKTLGKKFAEQGFQVHLLDQRNHGRSFHDTSFSYEDMVFDLLEYSKHHNMTNFCLLGHSMGGKTAMLFSATYPEIVSKLIVADIGPKEYPQHHNEILKGLSSLDFSEIKTRGEADTVLSKYVKETGTRQFLLKNLYWKEKGVLSLRVNLPVVMQTISEVGKSLPTQAAFDKETLFVKGENSGYIEEIDELLIKKHFPKASIETVSGAGHWLHAENPSEFHQIVANFL